MSTLQTSLARTLAGTFTLLALLILAGCQAVPVSAPAAGEADGAATAVPAEEVAPGEAAGGSLLIYSGRNENLVGPLLERYAEESGVNVEVRYGDTAEMAATILEEGQNSPADVFFGQDAGALGALAAAGRCVELPAELTDQVAARFVSPDSTWIGVSGRARTLAYNTDMLSEADLPASVSDLTDPAWAGRVGWAPTNGSFQAFVTALRVNAGEEAAREWLEGMVANDTQVYPNNTSIVEAVGSGEIEAGLVNHYYLYRFLAENPDFPVQNHYFPAGDVGAMINVAGACIVDTSENAAQAQAFVDYLLSPAAQQYFADETNEYALAGGDEVTLNPQIRPLAEIESPDFNLGDLSDLQGTLQLLQEVGALE